MIQRNLKDIYDLLKSKGLAFAFYSLPNESIQLVVGKNKHSNLLQNVLVQKKEVFVYRSFNKKNQLQYIAADYSGDLAGFPWNDYVSLPEYPKTLGPSKNKSLSEEEYLKAVDQIVQDIQQEKYKKLVFSRSENVATKRSGDEIFGRLVTNHPEAFNYLMHTIDGEIWFGASPEIILEKTENRYKTVALAGTVVNEDSHELFSSKNAHEQELVTDFIQHKLEESGAMDLVISEPIAHQAANVTHIKSNISFALKNDSFLDICQLAESLHPTPAVGTEPQHLADKLIEAKENYDRGLYAGYLGPLNLNDKTAFFVNLRCARYHGDSVELYVGGGITKDSNPKVEWEETKNKAKLILGAIS